MQPRYLDRIGIQEPPPIGLDGLTTLMQAHLSTVPFENIDVYRQTGVATDHAWALGKIVDRRRGGWCFENNGSFGWLLGSLGYDVTFLGAFVLLDPQDIVNMSHLCLRVDLDRPYLVDVGFGDSFNVPLPLAAEIKTDDGNDVHWLVEDGNYMVLMRGAPDGKPQYRFTAKRRSLEDFTPQSERLQTPGVSQFTAQPFATRLIDGGPDRVTLLADRIKFRRAGEWEEERVVADAWNATAEEWFGLEVDET